MRTGIDGDPVVRALVQIAAVLVVVGALRLTSVVTLPLAFAAFLVALLWPVFDGARQRVPDVVAAVATMLLFVLAVSVIGIGLGYTADRLVARGPRYAARWDELVGQAQVWAQARGLDMPSQDAVALGDVIGGLGDRIRAAVTGFFLSVALLLLGLLEVDAFRDKVDAAFGRPGHLARTTRRIAVTFQRYILIRTVLAVATGIGIGLAAWLSGVDMPFAWGLANGLLNYIPTIGSAIGVALPVMFTLFETGDPSRALVALVAIGGVQLVMGNYVAPVAQGEYLRLSPVAILLVVLFWGWVWGVLGAFLAVPLTTAVVLICREFERTRWIAVLLARCAEDVEEDDR